MRSQLCYVLSAIGLSLSRHKRPHVYFEDYFALSAGAQVVDTLFQLRGVELSCPGPAPSRDCLTPVSEPRRPCCSDPKGQQEIGAQRQTCCADETAKHTCKGCASSRPSRGGVSR